ncbi:Oligopeptide transporter 1 [Citrus sinensis]|uniref:Oligopeptide transporter 1 n=1 Tax=Citrus sinensis TaxID=2711 RepID=A0ACB8LXZ7_CITSI|nr:Oligopeptide transporter 1 [Citrus sinensis]
MRLRPLRLHLSSCHYKFARTNSDVLLLMFLTEDEINDSPIEQVRLTIPITDDPTLPTFTFRTWVLGPITCAALAFVQQFFDYRQNPIAVSSSCFKMLLFVLGKFMAATLPSNPVKVPGTKWTFSMNPGPFNIKEHVVVSILATTGLEVPFGTTVMGIRRIFYHKYLNFWIGLLMIMTSQILGYGFAGIFMKFLVYNPYMWSLHEVEERPKRGITKLQIFVMATVASFAYATLPGYLFPSLGALSVICWFWKNSVIAQQIGSGRHGLGVGSFSLDLSSISGALVFPLSTVVSLSIGTLLLLYVITPIAYWTNSNNARLFPFSSTQLFDQSGQVYNVSKVINDNDLTFNLKAYEEYSKLYMSVLFLFSVGFDFASLSASLSHFFLFHGRVRKAVATSLLGDPVSMSLGADFYSTSWSASSYNWPRYIYPGRPIANMVFKLYGLNIQSYALEFISELKMAHYMKIAPKSMFIAQITGTIISSLVGYATSWWLLSSVENICVPERLPKGSPWTCPGMNYTYAASIVWGAIGPQRIYFPNGQYSKQFYFFLIGLIGPLIIWGASKFFPEKEWIKNINISNLFGGTSSLPVYGVANFWSWTIVGILYNLIVYRNYKDWWASYNYVLAYGLDMGVAFLSLLTSLTLGLNGIYGVDWWGLDIGDHCPLAQCPTAPGISVEGCPTF